MTEAPVGSHGPRAYDVRFKGHLEARWGAWFDGLTLTAQPDGTTVIHGVLADQAALHGLLRKLRDTGLPLISVQQTPPDETTARTTAVGSHESAVELTTHTNDGSPRCSHTPSSSHQS